MTLHRPQSANGFTLIEVLIVVSIVMILGALSLGIGVDGVRRTTVAEERTLLAEALTRARNRAMNNIDEKAHGVRVTATDIIIFEGSAYSASDPLNESATRNSDISISGPTNPLTVVFTQLSGDVDSSQTGDIVVTNGAQQYTIAINTEGRINW